MRRSLIAVALLALAGTAGCDKPASPKKEPPKKAKVAAPAKPAGVKIDKAVLSLYSALPKVMESKTNPVTDDKVALGRMLYFDARLSKNHDISCSSCHDLAKGGDDGEPVSTGHKGQKGGRNSPTVYNAGLQFAQFWDGRADDLEAQAKGPILNPVEMAMPDEKRVLDTVSSIPAYVDAFKKAFPDDEDAVTYDNLAKAIGAFERKLVTPSRWDAFLAGDASALTDDEKKGFNLFSDTGCPQCHTGVLLGGSMYQKVGRERPWPNQKDKGRAEVTKGASDEMMFKVPTLRQIADTAPYFHDASATTLSDAVKKMAAHQLDKDLSDADVDAIVAFLKTLSGTPPKDLIAPPTLPKSTETTPKPDPS